MRLSGWLAGVILFMAGQALAVPTCTLNSKTCVDATPCKTVSGVSVCLGVDVTQTCWKYTSSYTCYDTTQTADTCATQKSKGCAIGSSVGIKNGPAGTPVMWEDTYDCGTFNAGICGGTPVSTCVSNINTLAVGTDTLVRNGAPAVAGGIPSPSSCWTTQKDYSCNDPGVMLDTCGPLVTAGCAVSNTACLKTAPNGSCILFEKTNLCGAASAANCVIDPTKTTACADSTVHKLINPAYDIFILPNAVPPAQSSAVASQSSCWKTSDTYLCANTGAGMQNTCQPLINRNCTYQVGKDQCVSTLPSNPATCTGYKQSYLCGQTVSKTTVQDCTAPNSLTGACKKTLVVGSVTQGASIAATITTNPPTGCTVGSTGLLSQLTCSATTVTATTTLVMAGSITYNGDCSTAATSIPGSLTCASSIGTYRSGTTCHIYAITGACGSRTAIPGVGFWTSGSISYSCPAGYNLSGTTCIPFPVVNYSWNDACATLP